MDTMRIVGLNVKWYRYKKGWTQEDLADITGFKMAYISTIETGNANLTCKNISVLSNIFKIDDAQLFDKVTARKAKNLPKRIDNLKS